MRLSPIPWICGAVLVTAVPAAGQHRPPARVVQPSLGAEPSADSAPEWWRNGGPRIRPTDERAVSLLLNGVERSARLRALVAAIDAAHVVVYLGVDPRMDGALAGRLTFLGNAGKYRYVRVVINPRLGGNLLIASLAHELQHVVEVVEHPGVTSEAALRKLYERIGQRTRAGGTEGWETSAAQATTREVRRELTEGVVGAVARQEPSKPPGTDEEGRRDRY